MARRVDPDRHESRKVEIAASVWRLASRRGLESVSMSEVAKEAGVSVGRVQYYFGSKDALLLYGLELAMGRIEERIEARLRRLPESVGTEDILRAAIGEVIGDDPDTQQAIRVSMAFLPRASEDERVAGVLFGDDPELLGLASQVVREAWECGRIERVPDPDADARILWALANSLGIEVAFGQTTAREAARVMDYHLDRTLGVRRGV